MASPPPCSILEPQGERSPYKHADYYQFLESMANSNWDDDVALDVLDCPAQSIGKGFSMSAPAANLDGYYELLENSSTMQPVEDVADVGPDQDIPAQNLRFSYEYSAYLKFQESTANPDRADDVPSVGLHSHATLKRQRDPSENISSPPTDHYRFLQRNAASQQYDDVAYGGPYYYTPTKTRRLFMKQEGENNWSRFYRELFEHLETGQIDVSGFLDDYLPFSGSHLNPPEEISLQCRSLVGPTSSADEFNIPTSDGRSFVSLQPNSSSCTRKSCENISSSPTDHYRFLQRNATSLLYDDVSYGGPYYYTPNKTRRLVMKVEGENEWQRSFRELMVSCEDESWYYNCGVTGGHQTHSSEIGTMNYDYIGSSSTSHSGCLESNTTLHHVDDLAYSAPNYSPPYNRQRLVMEVEDENECQRSFGELGVSCVAQDQYNCGVSDGPHFHSHEMGTRSLEVPTSENAAADLVTPVVISSSDSASVKDGEEKGNGLSEAGPPKATRHVQRERRKPRWLNDYV